MTGIPASPRQPLVVEINSHAMTGMVDALAVQALLTQVDPSLTLTATGHLVALASNRAATSEERLLEGLTRLFLGADRPALETVSADGIASWIAAPAPYPARGLLHQRILELEAALPADPARRLQAIDGLPAAALAAHAAADLAYRYALHALDPFVVTGVPALFAPWTETLSPDMLSAEWLGDRAQFLALLLARNAADRAVAVAGTTQQEFIDLGSGERVVEQSTLNWPRRRVQCGTAADDTIVGSDAVLNVLYGGAGDGHLSGGARNDRLEGEAGNDVLIGGGGEDVLLGGPGDDILYGHAPGRGDDHAPDRLVGGAGFDHYVVGDGDVVVDPDGRGELVSADGVLLTGVFHPVAEHVYRHASLDVALYRRDHGALLVVFGADGSTQRIQLGDTDQPWQPGDLGLDLAGERCRRSWSAAWTTTAWRAASRWSVARAMTASMDWRATTTLRWQRARPLGPRSPARRRG